MNADPYVRAMFGPHAVSVPINAIVQANPADQTVIAVVCIRGPAAMRLAFGSTRPHVLIMGDAVIRPHAVVESNHLTGDGIASIARSGFANLDAWVTRGRVILDACGRLPT